MKKIILTVLLIGMIYSNGICQFTTLYNYNFVPKINQSIDKYIADTNGLTLNTFKLTGANFLWDYSDLSFDPTALSITYETPQGTPYLSYFNNATHVTVNEFIGWYAYYYGDTNMFVNLGIGSPDCIYSYPDNIIEMKFPFKYNDQYIDSFTELYTQNSISHKCTGFYSVVADGWGTIKLQKNSYSNTIRIKTDMYAIDTATNYKSETFQTAYYWYDGKNNFPLLRASFMKYNSNNDTVFKEIKFITLSTITDIVSILPESNNNTINIYPNPAISELNIELNNNQKENVNITLTDLFGNMIKPIDSKVFSPGKILYTIDISDVPKGIYVVKIITGQEVKIKKILIQ